MAADCGFWDAATVSLLEVETSRKTETATAEMQVVMKLGAC
jgi:hypothetical protein